MLSGRRVCLDTVAELSPRGCRLSGPPMGQKCCRPRALWWLPGLWPLGRAGPQAERTLRVLWPSGYSSSRGLGLGKWVGPWFLLAGSAQEQLSPRARNGCLGLAIHRPRDLLTAAWVLVVGSASESGEPQGLGSGALGLRQWPGAALASHPPWCSHQGLLHSVGSHVLTEKGDGHPGSHSTACGMDRAVSFFFLLLGLGGVVFLRFKFSLYGSETHPQVRQ